MGARSVRATVHFSGPDYEVLQAHLFPGDRDEHAVIALAGVRRRDDGIDLMVRELHPLWDDEFVPGEYGYRQITARALARLGNHAADEGLAYVSCHSHPGATARNALSHDDLDAHRRVFPHLLDIVGGPVAGIALGTASAAGEVWIPGLDPVDLTALHVSSPNRRRLRPNPIHGGVVSERFDRQARLFGADGQHLLREQHVAVIGVGGGGSMLVEQLAHLGVGRITAIDFDVVKRHNLSRIVGATDDDAATGRKKVDVAAQLVRRIDPSVRFDAIDGDLADRHIAEQVIGCDFIFLATDTVTSRLVANAITQAHFVPAVQIGAKVDLRADGEIESVYVAVRPVSPGEGCLYCAGLIDANALRDEANSDEERAAQNYLGLPEVVDPSVITLNGVAASTATNLFLMSTVGLADRDLWRHRLFDARTGNWLSLNVPAKAGCPWCSRGTKSSFARADSAALPLRWATERSVQVKRPPRLRGLRHLLLGRGRRTRRRN